RAAELDKQVKVAVTIPVGERDTVPLLKVAGAGACGEILEVSALNIPEHEVDFQALVRHVAFPQVDVEVAVVVDVSEIRAHRSHGPVETDLFGEVDEAGRTEVAVEPGAARTFDLDPQCAAEDLGGLGPVVVN